MTSGSPYAATRFELKFDGHTLVFLGARWSTLGAPLTAGKLPGGQDAPALILARRRSTDTLISNWHRSGARKNCTLAMYNTGGAVVGRNELIDAWVSKIEIGWGAGHFTGMPGQGTTASSEPMESITIEFTKIKLGY